MLKTIRPYLPGKFFSRGRLSALFCLCLVLATLAACGDSNPTVTPQPATATPAPPTATPVPPTPTATLGNPLNGSTPGTGGATTPGKTALPGIPDEIKKPFALISADLENRSKLPAASFQVTGYSTQTFPDSALGCPDPNMMYTQVLTPGYTIQVTAGGQSYDYRSNIAGTHIVLCGPNGQPVPTPKS